MNRKIVAFFIILAGLPYLACGQARPTEFQLTKINRNFVTTPNIAYNGGPQYRTDQTARWLEVEAEFIAAPDFTDELTLKYYILLNGKLLTGECTVVAVPAGRENRVVMYVSPHGITRCLGSQPPNTNSVQNITIQILQKGTLKDELNLNRAPAQWYAQVQALPGLVLNKNETPFAPLFWDRYEQLKPATR